LAAIRIHYSFVTSDWAKLAGSASAAAPWSFLELANMRRAAGGQLRLIVLGPWGAFRSLIRDGLRVADRFGQHEAQLILGHRWLPRGR